MIDQAGSEQGYQARLTKEERFYRECRSVHDLPDIFHYWSNRHIRPKLETFGFSSPNGMFRKFIGDQFLLANNGSKRFASIGCGNCDLEIEIALHLRGKGYTDFAIDCFDLNPAMLGRGRNAAEKNNVAGHIRFIGSDLNEWEPAGEYDAVIANQALHHVLRLENLFDRVKRCLKPSGAFLVSDMIGRNGHQRWPEALGIVQEFWRKLPPSYRFNRLLERYEESFEDWDCSGESFEGIRSQDVLPLLLECFHFRLFIGFANVIDPFVDRSFGYSFDAAADWDRHFIDQVHQRDDEEMIAGRIKPTHMLAVVGNIRPQSVLCHEPLTPKYCVRNPAATEAAAAVFGGKPYEWHAWPHDPRTELEIACGRWNAARQKAAQESQHLRESIQRLNAHAQELDRQLDERTAWALKLDQELAEATEWGQRLDKQFQERTEWALELERDLGQWTEFAMLLREQLAQRDREMEERTAWALRLDAELVDRRAQIALLARELEQVGWARALDRRFHDFFDRAYRLARRIRNVRRRPRV